MFNLLKSFHSNVLMNPISIRTVEHRPQNVGIQHSEEDSKNDRSDRLGESGGETLPKLDGQNPNAPNTATASVLSEHALPPPPKPIPPKMLHPNYFKSSGTYKTKRVFKVIIIGDAGVGKTCLSYRFCNGRFPGATEATIGVDFRERSLIIDEELIRVQLWDTAGQERYRQSIVAHYYRNVNAVVFVYDVFEPKSFKSLPAWIAECRKHALTASEDTPHILIGNKCDLQQMKGGTTLPAVERERVKMDQAQVFADKNDMALFETSALADSESDHVESIFLTLVHKLRQSKPMHVQSTEERSWREQKILLKANEAAKLGEEEEEGGMCC